MSPPKVTESARRRREYWVEFLGALRLADPDIRVPTPNTLGNLWLNLRGRNLWITVYAASSLGRIGVFLRGKPEYYGKIWAKWKQMEAQIGAQVGWDPDHDHWSVGVTKKADATNRGLAAATSMVGVTVEGIYWRFQAVGHPIAAAGKSSLMSGPKMIGHWYTQPE